MGKPRGSPAGHPNPGAQGEAEGGQAGEGRWDVKAEPEIHLGRRVRDCAGGAGGYLRWQSETPPLPNAGSSATLKELRSGVTNRDRGGRGSGARQVSQILLWDLLRAQVQHSCITGDRGEGTAQGHSSGAGCGADSGRWRRVGPTVSCPWPAANPARCPQSSLHFRVAENRHPPFQKVTLRQHSKL